MPRLVGVGDKSRRSAIAEAVRRIAGRASDALTGTAFTLPLRDQSEIAVLPDGTRMHDQQVESVEGARWIAWRKANQPR